MKHHHHPATTAGRRGASYAGSGARPRSKITGPGKPIRDRRPSQPAACARQRTTNIPNHHGQCDYTSHTRSHYPHSPPNGRSAGWPAAPVCGGERRPRPHTSGSRAVWTTRDPDLPQPGVHRRRIEPPHSFDNVKGGEPIGAECQRTRRQHARCLEGMCPARRRHELTINEAWTAPAAMIRIGRSHGGRHRKIRSGIITPHGRGRQRRSTRDRTVQHGPGRAGRDTAPVRPSRPKPPVLAAPSATAPAAR